MRRFLFVLLIALVVSASACTGIGSGKSTTKIESKDLVKINKLDIFPGTTVKPEDIVQIRMEVENIGQVPVDIDVGDLTKGEKVLYDYCPYVFTKTTTPMDIFGSYDTKETMSNVPSEKIRVQPGRNVIFQWEFQARKAESLFNLNTECTLGTKVTYHAQAKTTTYIYFSSPSEISQKVYTGEDLNQKGDNIASHGPVAVNVETPPQPITGSTGTSPRTWHVFLNVKNVGSGIASVEEMNFTIPNDVTLRDAGACKLANETGLATLSINGSGKDKDLLKVGLGSTSKVPCTLPAPPVDILQSYRFESSAIYKYDVFKGTKLIVNTK